MLWFGCNLTLLHNSPHDLRLARAQAGRQLG
jgi:hypothetical protein